jgi:hypothetical protein
MSKRVQDPTAVRPSHDHRRLSGGRIPKQGGKHTPSTTSESEGRPKPPKHPRLPVVAALGAVVLGGGIAYGVATLGDSGTTGSAPPSTLQADLQAIGMTRVEYARKASALTGSGRFGSADILRAIAYKKGGGTALTILDPVPPAKATAAGRTPFVRTAGGAPGVGAAGSSSVSPALLARTGPDRVPGWSLAPDGR